MMFDTSWRRVGQNLHRRVGGACGEDPVVAEVEQAACGIGGERDVHPVLDRNGSGNHVDQAIRVYRGVARLLVPALDPGVPRGEFGRIRTERSASAGRQRTVERDGLRSLVRVNDTGHLAWLAHQFAMVIRYGHPIVRLEAQNLVTADPCHRQDGLRAADFDGLDGGDDRTVVARPFELRGAEGARYLYLD